MKIKVTFTATYDVDLPALAEELNEEDGSNIDASDIQQALEGTFMIDALVGSALKLVKDSDNVEVEFVSEKAKP